MTTKFVGFFKLVEAGGAPGCPVCRCLRDDGASYLSALMYEQVNDPATRAALRASWGFCNWHAWILTELSSPGLGVAIIYEDLLGGVLARLRRLLVKVGRGALRSRGLFQLFGRRPRIAMLDQRRRKPRCPICESRRASEETYLRTLLDFTGDPDFDRAFDRSQGVCVPHVLRLIEIGREHPRLEPLLRKIEGKWRGLQDQLKRFIAKHDYRVTEKLSDEEARSWRQALEMLSGAPGLFGNELAPGRPEVVPTPPSVAARPVEPTTEDIETLRFEKAKLELRLKTLTDQYNEVSGRAAALHYRLWQVLEDRKVLELNLSGAEAGSRLLEQTVEELRRELDQLRPRTEAQSPGRHE